MMGHSEPRVSLWQTRNTTPRSQSFYISHLDDSCQQHELCYECDVSDLLSPALVIQTVKTTHTETIYILL